jgi:hypothetical protein
MSKVLDKATSHFRERLSGELKSINVPEWDCKIFFKDVNTLREESKIVELAQQGKTVEALVQTLVIKARNEDGTRMFTEVDKVILMNEVDPNVIIRACSQMSEAVTQQSLEDVEKN